MSSPQELSSETLGDIMLWHDQNSVRRHAWNEPGAYPRSRACSASEGALAAGDDAFVLHENSAGVVVWPSALEAATSAMEVMAVAGRNAALLVVEKMGGTGRA